MTPSLTWVLFWVTFGVVGFLVVIGAIGALTEGPRCRRAEVAHRAAWTRGDGVPLADIHKGWPLYAGTLQVVLDPEGHTVAWALPVWRRCRQMPCATAQKDAHRWHFWYWEFGPRMDEEDKPDAPQS